MWRNLGGSKMAACGGTLAWEYFRHFITSMPWVPRYTAKCFSYIRYFHLSRKSGIKYPTLLRNHFDDYRNASIFLGARAIIRANEKSVVLQLWRVQPQGILILCNIFLHAL